MKSEILVPLDGSRRAEAVLPFVVTLARARTSKVVLFRVVAPPIISSHWFAHAAAYSQAAHDEEAMVCSAYLADQAQRLEAADLQVEAELHFGDPAHCIVERAARSPYECTIAMASHGHGAATALLAVVFLVPVAAAQTMSPGDHHGMMITGSECGMAGRMGPASSSACSLLAIAADKLGMSHADLAAALQNDATLAEAKDVTLDTIVDAFLAAHSAQMQEAVRRGAITQTDADARLATMRANVLARLTQPAQLTVGGPDWMLDDGLYDHGNVPAHHGGAMHRRHP